MKKNKTTKRALLSSVIALMICLAMLMGTTYAWFTDSAASSGNVIKSGTLNIDLLVKGGETGYTDYTSIKASSAPVFNYQLWEPGYTDWANVKVTTTGNLALKYTMRITAEGTVSELGDVIDVYYAPSEIAQPATRPADLATTGLTRLGTLSEVLAGTVTVNDTLIPGSNTEDFATIALHMQETAGNEYQDKELGSSFSIQILATQYTYEEDSFDDQYDLNAEYPWAGEADTSWFVATDSEVTLSTPAQLAGFSQLVAEGNTFQGKTVKLDSDVDLNGVAWTPIGVFNGTNFSSAFRGTFDGQGHTVSNLNVSTTGAAGLFGEVYIGTIKNLTVDNANVNTNRMAGAIVGQLYGSLENCHVTNSTVTAVPNAEGASFDNGDKVGGLVGWIGDNGNNRQITGCSATNVTLTAYRDVGGLAGHIQKTTSITDCAVENINITVDKLTNAYGNSSINAGYIYGRAADASTNTLHNNIESGTNSITVNQ